MKPYFIPVFCFILLFVAPLGFATEIVQVSNDFYTATKDTTPSKHSNDPNPPLYFAMERIDDSNFGTWLSFAKEQSSIAIRLQSFLFWEEPAPDPDQVETAEDRIWTEEMRKKRDQAVQQYGSYRDIIKSAPDPLDKLRRCLNFHDQSEVWVVYVLNKKPEAKYLPKDIKNIEMAVTVLTDPSVPFELHMGISRGIIYLKEGNTPHKNIAAQLHAFAAKVMRQRDSNKRYMITTPLPVMKDILVKTLPPGSYWEGHNRQDSLISQIGSHRYERDFKFKLVDEKGGLLFETSHGPADNYKWFFSNTQPSAAYPYFTVNLEKLAALF